MPKKTHGRPARSKNRQRRPAGPPANRPSGAVVEEVETIAVAQAAAPMTTAAPPPASPRLATRRAPPSRKTAGIPINYTYLSHDLKQLALLAPGMVILVVIAFIFLH